MFKKIYHGVKGFCSKVKDKGAEICATVAVAGSAFVASVAPASATSTDIDDIFTAGALTGLNTNVKTVILALVGLTLILVGYRWYRKATGR